MRVAFDDWYKAASNTQDLLVLSTTLIVMVRRLIPIQNPRIVAEDQEDEQPHSEQNDPEYFHALFLYMFGHCVIIFCSLLAWLSRIPLQIV